MRTLIVVEVDATEPLTVAQVADNLHASVALDGARITKLIKAARTRVEQRTGLSLVARVVELAQDGFYADAIANPSPSNLTGPCYTHPRILLPYGPVGDVVSVKYTDEDAALQTLATNQWRVDRYTVPPALIPAYGVTWPNTLSDVASVKVQYNAGFNADGAPEPQEVPDDLVQAMHLLIGHWFANREAAVTGTISSVVHLGFDECLQGYREGLGV